MNTVTAELVITKAVRIPSMRGAARVEPAGSVIRWGELLGPSAPTRAECDALDALAVVREVGAGQAVFTRGAPLHTLSVLLAGDVALGLAAPGGVMRTERLVRGPAWLDASSAWLPGATHLLDAVALTPARVAELARDPLQALLDQRPQLARRLLVSLAREVQRLALHNHDLIHKDAPARLASWLAARQLPVADDPGRAVVQLSERKSDIASQLGMTPETMSRLMRNLSEKGVIEVDGYTVRVLDAAELERLAAA